MNTRLFVHQARSAARKLYTSLLCPQHCLLCGHRSESGLPLCRECITTRFQSYVPPASCEPTVNNGCGEPSSPTLPCTATVEQRCIPPERCRHCGKILISERGYCTGCKSLKSEDSENTGQPEQSGEHKGCDLMFTLFPYTGLGQRLLPQWKNQSIRTLSTVFAPLVYSFLMQNPYLMQLPLVPVPPRPKKLRERGWDQIEDLAADLAIYPGITLLRCLKRLDGEAQKKLSKQDRAHNLQGKITVSAKSVPDTLILLDDVRTTGATLTACAQAVKAAGCKTVYGLCLFFD